MSKRIVAVICCLALVLTPFPATVFDSGAAAAIDPISVTFSDDNVAAFTAAGGSFETGTSSEGGIVKDEVSHDGDGAAFKTSHIKDNTDYTSIVNGAQINFGTPLPADTNYRISAWFYVPSEGNKDVEGKANLIGPGILVNGAAGSNEYKYPTSAQEAGTVTYDEWMQVTFETPAYGDEIEFIIFRFYTNDKPTHPEVWYLDDVSITTFVSNENTEIQDLTPLKDVYKDYFLFGTSGGSTDMSGKRFDLITKHFDTFTFGNEMKPENMQKTEGIFTYDTVDGMIATLKENSINIIGHTLVWHSQSPKWLWSEKELAQARLEAHIEEVLTHTGPDLVAVDVVNEAFKDSTGTNDWREEMRNEGWYTALGSDFIEIAFRKADEVRQKIGRPDLKLYYNDFNLDELNKSTNVYQMVSELREKGVPIDGIGMQAHYNQDTSPKNVQRSLDLFSTIPGIEVSVTELDITIQSSLGNSGLTEEEDKRQAALYAQLFSLYKQYAKGSANTNPDESKHILARVTLWGTTDNLSWRSDRFPLLFDKNFQAKGAYYAVLDPVGYMEENKIQDPTVPYIPPTAMAAKGTPVIDGEMDDIWNNTEEISVDMPVNNGTVNATAKARMLWDEEYLYVYAVVTDPILDESSNDSYQQDSIEVFVSETNHKEESYKEGDGQYRVSFTNNQSFNAKSSEGFESAAKSDNDGYVVELKVKLYATTPADGSVIGFDLQVNDATGGNRTALAIWSDLTGKGFQNASTWGNLTLVNELPVEEPSPSPEPTPTVEPTPTTDVSGESDSGEAPLIATWIIVMIILLVIAAAGVVVFVVMKNKGKTK